MSNKALFLDRDGVINVDKGYVGQREDFEFIDGIFSTIRYFVAQGYRPVIVTNQSGIGRGLYSEMQFNELCTWMQAQFDQQGISPIPVYFCPHHPTAANPPYRQHCRCRKPAPGMLLKASLEHDLDTSQSIMIGDSWRDMEAAQLAGVQTKILVSTTEIPEPQRIENGVVQVRNVAEIAELTL